MYYLFLCACLTLAYAQTFEQVNTTQGVVQGTQSGEYYTFFGIPYAGSTSGVNRFKAPTAPPNFPGLFYATDSSVICAQPTERGLIGVEDCLTLNVFTKMPPNTNNLKPVLVWIYGEEYTNTDTSLLSYRMLLDDVVVVQLNYRLSIFGFLCLGVEEAPGNAGLKDLVAGLEWIQRNIAGFRGDPNNVVLFGHGSGGAMVDLLTMSPMTDGLFHKAITQSGSALAPWAISYNPVGVAKAVGAKLGYTEKANEELASLLASTDLSLLTPVLNDFEILNNTALFAPCIENINLNPNETFLSEAPLTLLRSGNYSHIPYLMGYTNQEGSIRAVEAAFGNWLTKMQNNFTDFLQVDLDFGTNVTTVERTIREYYFGQDTINMATIEGFMGYHGDTMFLVSIIRGARERAATSSAPVRLMEFTYVGTNNSNWAVPHIPITGARHGVLINFLLGYDIRRVDADAAQAVGERYTAFMRTGDPQRISTSSVQWDAITTSTFNYILLSGGDGPAANTSIFGESRMTNPHSQRMTFWDDLYSKYYRAPTSVVSGSGKFLSYALVIWFAQLFVYFV